MLPDPLWPNLEKLFPFANASASVIAIITLPLVLWRLSNLEKQVHTIIHNDLKHIYVELLARNGKRTRK